MTDHPILICVSGFAASPPEGSRIPVVVATNERVRSDHPAVKLAPERFLPFGVPDRDIAERRIEIAADKGTRNARDHARAVEREARTTLAERVGGWVVDRTRRTADPDMRDYVARQGELRWPTPDNHDEAEPAVTAEVSSGAPRRRRGRDARPAIADYLGDDAA